MAAQAQPNYELASVRTEPVQMRVKDDESPQLGQSMAPIVPFEMAAAEAPVYPRSFLLGTLQSGAFRALKAIPVVVDRSDWGVTAAWAAVDEFGYGESAADAIHDLCRSLTSLYRSLKEDQSRLGKDLNTVWLTLQEYVVPTR